MNDDKEINDLATAIAELIEDMGADPPQCLMAIGMVANQLIFDHWPPHLQAKTAKVFSVTLHDSLVADLEPHTTH